MEFLLLTNDAATARAAEAAGIDRICVDLERLGKAERQRGRRLFLSAHTLDDVGRIKGTLRRSRLMVRVDAPHAGLAEQVAAVIERGADEVMLPYFDRLQDAADFTNAVVEGGAVPVLLIERPGAVALLRELCRLPGLAGVHLGLNDLSLSLGEPSWFSLLTHPILDAACEQLRGERTAFGFGGIARLSRKDLPIDPELVLADQVCQGARLGWLGRSFRDTALEDFARELDGVREAVAFWQFAGDEERTVMRRKLRDQVLSVSAN